MIVNEYVYTEELLTDMYRLWSGVYRWKKARIAVAAAMTLVSAWLVAVSCSKGTIVLLSLWALIFALLIVMNTVLPRRLARLQMRRLRETYGDGPVRMRVSVGENVLLETGESNRASIRAEDIARYAETATGFLLITLGRQLIALRGDSFIEGGADELRGWLSAHGVKRKK